MALANDIDLLEETFSELEYFLLAHAKERSNAQISVENLKAAAGLMGGLSVDQDVIAVVMLRLRNRHEMLRSVLQVPELTKHRRVMMMQFGLDPVTGEGMWIS